MQRGGSSPAPSRAESFESGGYLSSGSGPSQQQALDAKGQELAQLQATAQVHEQELATIKNTIGWKALNKYRETREKSAVFRYLHFLFTEPVKRGSKKK